MQIAFASNERYFDGLLLAISSILEYSHTSPAFCIHVLDGGLSLAARRSLERLIHNRGHGATLTWHGVDIDQFKGVKVLQDSPLTYARLLLPDLFPHLPEIIYCDADVWYGADLRPLWETDIAGRAAAAVQDTVIPTLDGDGPWLEADAEDRNLPYFNAGIMKINLVWWREHGISRTALNLAQTDPEKCRCWDQTILNHLLRRHLVWMDPGMNYLMTEANAVDRGDDVCDGKNIHYICPTKPWMRFSRKRSFLHWRREYCELVSAHPTYLFQWRFWAEYLWADWIVASRFVTPVSAFLLDSRLYKILPGLNREKLTAHLGAWRSGRDTRDA